MGPIISGSCLLSLMQRYTPRQAHTPLTSVYLPPNSLARISVRQNHIASCMRHDPHINEPYELHETPAKPNGTSTNEHINTPGYVPWCACFCNVLQMKQHHSIPLE